ncbi:hypothetical protein [Streptomyces hydrogenans]|uniref:hypothetical protein n=1 Tax=Streptomyces hydrogenans TaxID=1873719 RepID=UPI00380F88F9
METDAVDASARPPYAVVPSMRTPHWFAECDPRARVPVKVRADGGLDPSILAVVPELARRAVPLDQNVFAGGLDDVPSLAAAQALLWSTLLPVFAGWALSGPA